MKLRDKVAPKRIWLIEMGDETVWSGDPDPNDCGILDGVEYTRADAVMEATGWQGIATAEIEGYEQNPRLLVLLDGCPVIAKYEKDNVGFHEWFLDNLTGGFAVTCKPTHFMPLPPPPFEGTKHD